MKRILSNYIKPDLDKKLVLITGPRQCGKTTLSKQLFDDYDYINYDSAEDRLVLQEKSWDRKKPLIIFDELHKMQDWKRWLKGTYDTEGINPRLLVTGSAKMDVYRRVGDSLAGRFFQYHLHPIDLKEAKQYLPSISPTQCFERLLNYSGFPEPFLENSQSFYKRWRQSHLDIILRQDLLDLQVVRDIQAIETLVALLKKRVGSSVSYANLARDLERDASTIKRWLNLLEELYIIFKVTPYHKNIARSLLKEPKYYFYDIAQVEGDIGPRFENLVACALLKELDFLRDTQGIIPGLFYLRTKSHQELDFLITLDNKPSLLIEVKWEDEKPAPGFNYFLKFFGDEIRQLQLVKELSRDKTYPNGIEVRSAVKWLSEIAILPTTS